MCNFIEYGCTILQLSDDEAHAIIDADYAIHTLVQAKFAALSEAVAELDARQRERDARYAKSKRKEMELVASREVRVWNLL